MKKNKKTKLLIATEKRSAKVQSLFIQHLAFTVDTQSYTFIRG